MSGWIFARGRGATAQLAASLAPGSTTVNLQGAVGTFAVINLLFASAAEPAGVGQPATQWLGRVQTVAGNQISASVPQPIALPAGTQVWTPAAHIEVRAQGGWAAPERIDAGAAHARSATGLWFTCAVHQPRHTAALRLSGLTPAALQALLAFLVESERTAPALVVISPRHELTGIRLGAGPYEISDHAQARTLTLPLVILGSEVYP